MSTAAGPKPDTRRKLRVLVVDDQKDTARMLQLFIAGAGHEVQTAGTKAAALELAGQTPFDVVVSDLRLPDGSGNELIKELQARQAIKGIAFTGLSGAEEQVTSRAAGFSALLVKPQGLDSLLETIDRVAAEG
ncbi:MAG TPA: response regulator [Phycisphaerae bacterium]|jgi:CheY-like chemotaxis protein|nr:response regulator [Phycisphaerae bacterium]HOB72942.1 response regulator [Phycisphaerae bacterium]HOJ53009.1 response regulator [Phycisphaerae bacterium]HOL24746.1 response regulator [Phycisphaerae bacterium]HPP19282.1 response regulator [Phycisphaerae bacterium]